MMSADPPLSDLEGSWSDRLAYIVDTMRAMSRQTDPEDMVRSYGARIRRLLPSDRRISLSRRGLEKPLYRITRFSEWAERINPWKEPHRLPQFDRGLLGNLLYADVPQIIDELQVAEDDPAREYLAGQRSLMAIPNYDQGVALNMIVSTSSQPGAFDRERFPEIVWMSNLFGRATHNLVLSGQLQEAYASIDRELRIVADIQQSLLPRDLPEIPTLALAANYRTSNGRAEIITTSFP